MIISIATQTGLNLYVQFRDSSGNIWNGSVFETYNSANWSTYSQTGTEQSGSGFYDMTAPTFAAGSYSYIWYQRIGGSPALSDPSAGAGNYVVPSTAAAITAPVGLINQLRSLANDTTTSNFIKFETPIGAADGANKYFKLQYENIVTASVYISYGTTFRTQAGFTVDLTNGIITFTSAPASATELLTDYNFLWFSDTEYSEFLVTASQHLGETDPDDVDTGLVMALLQYALGYYWQRRASAYAHRYSSSSMGVSAQVDVITTNFMKLANMAFNTGEKFRIQFYQRQGQREAPASGTQTYNIDPYTPQR